jgi:hypothetical protein
MRNVNMMDNDDQLKNTRSSILQATQFENVNDFDVLCGKGKKTFHHGRYKSKDIVANFCLYSLAH